VGNPVSLRLRDERPPHRSRRGELRLVRQPPSASLLGAGGNLLSDGASTYAYNHANRMTSVVQGDDTYTYAYPAKNMRGERQRPGRSVVANSQRRGDELYPRHHYGIDSSARRWHERLPLPR